jgi:hypothetical protein
MEKRFMRVILYDGKIVYEDYLYTQLLGAVKKVGSFLIVKTFHYEYIKNIKDLK